MPLYQFRCNTCGESRDALVNRELAKKLEFICVGCGGGMTLEPVLALNILRSRTSRDDRKTVPQEVQRQGKGCGHAYHCRCAVNLTKPNPFRDEIRKANGIVDQE